MLYDQTDNYLIDRPVQVTENDLTKCGCQVLLGTDLLKNCLLGNSSAECKDGVSKLARVDLFRSLGTPSGFGRECGGLLSGGVEDSTPGYCRPALRAESRRAGKGISRAHEPRLANG